MKLVIVSLLMSAGLAATSAAEAHPGGHQGRWVLNPAKCPDLVEDWRDRRESRRDERYDRNRRDVREDRRDRRESRRDEAVTRCPASAYEWRGPRYRAKYHPARPRAVAVYYNPYQRQYYRRGHGGGRIIIRF